MKITVTEPTIMNPLSQSDMSLIAAMIDERIGKAKREWALLYANYRKQPKEIYPPGVIDARPASMNAEDCEILRK